MKPLTVAWLLTLTLVAWSAYTVETKYERAIERSKSTIELLYRQTAAHERTVAAASLLRAEQESAERDLAGISRDTSSSLVTASLLSMLHDLGKAYSTAVRDIEPGRTIPDGALQATDLTLRVQGSFQDILRFIAALSAQNEPIRVSNTELTLASQVATPAHGPELDATIHAVLYRLAAELHAGEKRVAATP